MTDLILVILLVLSGVVLLLLEMFLLPGFGIAGISGFGSLIGAIVVAYSQLGSAAGRITLLGCIILSAVAVYMFIRSRALDKMSLDATIDSKVDLAAPGKKIETLEAEAEKMQKNENKNN